MTPLRVCVYLVRVELPCSHPLTLTGAKRLSSRCQQLRFFAFFLATEPPSAHKQRLNGSAGKSVSLGAEPQSLMDWMRIDG